MVDSIRQLLELQALEQAVLDIRKKEDVCTSHKTSLQNLIQQAQQQQLERKKALQGLKAECTQLEDSLTSKENQLVQQKARQALSKKQEEFQQIETSIQELVQTIETVQDCLLNKLDLLEKQTREVGKSQIEMQQQVQSWEKQLRQIESEMGSLRAEEAQRQEHVQTFESQLKGPFYEAYLNLRAAKKAIPHVVPISEQGKCTGCYLALSSELISAIDQSPMPTFCEHCGRILYKA